MASNQSFTTQVLELQYQGNNHEALELLKETTEDQGFLSIIKGIALALSGQGHIAASYLNSTFEPTQAEEYSNFAMAQLLTSKPAKALESIEKAIDLGASRAVAFGRLGVIQLTLGNLDEAREAYQEAINREAGRAEWHNNLAGIFVRQQRLEQALQNYEIALKLKPELEQAINAKQRVLIALERTEEVVDELEASLEKHPESFETQMRLAHALVQDNRHPEAIQLIAKMILPVEEVEKPEILIPSNDEKTEAQKFWEHQIAYRAFLAEVFSDKAMYFRAQTILEQLLELEPENPFPFIQKQANMLVEVGQFDRAEELLDHAEEEHPDENPIKLARASLYCESGRYEEAEGIQRELLETYPGDARLKSQLGQTLLWTGKLDEAAQLFKDASDINPMALAQMVNAKQMPQDEGSLKKMKAIADNVMMAAPARITMGFALAEIYDKKKEYDQAFHYLELANRLTDKNLHYSVEGFSKQVDAVQSAFNKEFFDSAPRIRESDRTPIFIVGMPRSGTTLTEQILCSHPDIFGAGELGLMSRLTRLIPKVLKTREPYPNCIAQMTSHLFEEAARFYLNGIFQLDNNHPFVVDKMPHNFMHVGLISICLPKAKIIHIQRDPRDTALSNFQQNFKAKNGGLGYSFNLEKMAAQFNDYDRMMAHWRNVLSERIIEITYEELVADQEGMTRALLDYVGVGWDDQVKDFHKTERAVRTASVSQVRQPIYQTSRQKWRNYEGYLRPFLKNLKPEVTAKWDQAID